jgi:RimJ/RimL family protein N-acetyltransferase
VRAAVLARNEAGRAFAERLGFRALATRARRMVSEREELVVLERALRD